MGSSKVIILSAVYLILGLYTVSYNAADETNFSAALVVASETQAEQLAKTGVSLALQKFANNLSLYTIAPTTVTTMGGTITYSASRPAAFPLNQTQVVATGYYEGRSIKSTAVFHQYGGRWKLLRVINENV
ncbi:MAG: hypothetical protein ACYC09_07600 [Bacteroidota bacterium]